MFRKWCGGEDIEGRGNRRDGIKGEVIVDCDCEEM